MEEGRLGSERDKGIGPQGYGGGGHVDGDDTAQAVGRDAHRTVGAAPDVGVHLVDDLAYAGVDGTMKRTRSSGPAFSRSRRTRSVIAWAWYSAECSLV
jgi:hypothetical protein